MPSPRPWKMKRHLLSSQVMSPEWTTLKGQPAIPEAKEGKPTKIQIKLKAPFSLNTEKTTQTETELKDVRAAKGS